MTEIALANLLGLIVWAFVLLILIGFVMMIGRVLFKLAAGFIFMLVVLQAHDYTASILGADVATGVTVLAIAALVASGANSGRREPREAAARAQRYAAAKREEEQNEFLRRREEARTQQEEARKALEAQRAAEFWSKMFS